MGIVYSVTSYRMVLSRLDISSMKEKIVRSAGRGWKKIERSEFTNMSNARIFLEGRRPKARIDEKEDGFCEVTFFVLCEEQKGYDGEIIRNDVLNMALPDQK